MDDIVTHVTERNGKTILIPDAAMLADAIRKLPPGNTSSLADVRKALAASHGAESCCPVTVQRHVVAFSHAGDVPYWRVIDANMPFANRLQGGAERVREMLAAES